MDRGGNARAAGLPSPASVFYNEAMWTYVKRLVTGRPAPRPASSVRKDVLRYEIQPGAYLEVFWKVLTIGRGPAVSLYVHGEEVLKIDCFGAGKGHYHVNARQWSRARPGIVQRIYLREPTVEAQIERAVFELQQNAPVYLQQNDDPRIRGFVMDPAKLREATEWMNTTMREYMRRVPQGPDRGQADSPGA